MDLSEVDDRADWRQVGGLYQQMSSLLSNSTGPDELPDIMAGALALRLGRVFAAYASREEKFGEDLLTIMSDVDGLTGDAPSRFRRLYADERFKALTPYQQENSKRRRPKPFEAAIETCRRIRDLNSLRRVTAAARVSTAGILGGSTTYGRFYNVKGAPSIEYPASDIDLMLIVPDVKEIPALCEALMNISALDTDSVHLFSDRAKVYESLRADTPGTDVLFSQKIPIWKNVADDFLEGTGIWPQYDVSIHIATIDLFSRMILEDVSRIEDDVRVEIFDYKAELPISRYAARGFNGIDSWRESESSPVDRGHVWRVQVFDTKEERFKPGLHQGLVMPQFEIRWDDEPLSLRVPIANFKWKILERLRDERARRPWEVQHLSLCHPRFSIFAPHVKREVDSFSIES
ncbi:hypothetical protein OG365_25015 [Streptomyces sp. NBC_00853]|uniref:hypothetical protein n=1 Tax=Streptomyces sp. NBC_00853 TaxID=2903681 RepID=UPI003873721C|nr:hypothetical protein OG365_25015 [Streptomyces sp. NBC_00853]